MKGLSRLTGECCAIRDGLSILVIRWEDNNLANLINAPAKSVYSADALLQTCWRKWKVQMQEGMRKLAGGRTTPDMLEQLERWLASYRLEASGSPVDREAER